MSDTKPNIAPSAAASRNSAAHNIAFFCAEYALEWDLPTYAGGLGVLAGDYVAEAGARRFPLQAVGLFYREGQNSLRPAGHAPEDFVTKAGLELVTHRSGGRLLVEVPIHNSRVYARAWQWTKNGATVYLLDTHIPENEPSDQEITNSLYTEDREMRLKQEILLGVGGFRLLAKLGYHSSVYHLNEGHSAFLALELVAHEMRHQKTDFYTACEFARKHIVFTNHTLVAAGQEQFSTELVSAMLARYAEELAVPVADILSLGTIEGSNLFAMTSLSFRLSSRSNAVSRLHAAKAREVWPKNHMGSITNGIYVPRWDKIGPVATARDFWNKHQENKEKLLVYIKNQTGSAWKKETLLFGWARRFVPYKRPLAFIEDIKKFLRLATDPKQPLRLVFAGPTSNQDSNHNELLTALKKMIADKLQGTAVFLPNYNLKLAELMTGGCDVWLNTPVVGSEACGTSLMKAMLSGVLPLSTRDGWVDEADLTPSGWVVDEPQVGEKMLALAENEIIPLYYKHLANPNDTDWLKRMQNGRQLIMKQFSASRMLDEYIAQLYLPTLTQKHKHAAD